MSRLLLLVVFVLCMLGSCLAAMYAVRSEPTPSLTADRRFADLGIMRQQALRTARFRLLNSSNVTINITGVEKTCRCTTSHPKLSVLRPGEETDLEVTFSSGTSKGELTTRVAVLYQRADDDETYGIQLHLRAVVDPEYDITPRRLTFDLSDNQTVAFVDVSSSYVNDFRVERVVCTKRFFTARVVSENVSGGLYRIRVGFDPHLYRRDAGRADLIVFTNSVRVPTTRVPLTCVH